MAYINTITQRPNLSRRAFWDIDMERLDFTQYADFIITRIFERGTAGDKEVITQYYGSDKIITVLTSSPSLLPEAIAAAKQLFHLTDNEFACFKQKASAPNYSRF